MPFGGFLTPKELMKMIMSGEPPEGGVIIGIPERQERPLFKLGDVKKSPEIKSEADKSPILVELLTQCLHRHVTGDGGELSADEKITHFEDIMKQNQVQSNFVISSEVTIYIITNKSRTGTIILFANEFPGIPNEYKT